MSRRDLANEKSERERKGDGFAGPTDDADGNGCRRVEIYLVPKLQFGNALAAVGSHARRPPADTPVCGTESRSPARFQTQFGNEGSELVIHFEEVLWLAICRG